MSTMWVAWTSLNPKGSACRAAMAAWRSSDARMAAMMASIMSSALIRPSTMWARSRAFLSRNSDRRRMTSTWWAT